MGVSYLKVLAFSEIFLALEIGISGMFNGLKNTKTPTIISTFSNALRIPLAYLVFYLKLDITYIWAVISFCTFLKGILNYIFLRNLLEKTLILNYNVLKKIKIWYYTFVIFYKIFD
ncbi:MATE domain protein [Parvimonas sp. oral taxon 393 str. F0440]|nr:MATE domain protein [Parvimonas sp. oral taxon 393 str. F0440]